ncbi:Ig-like domain-containing protein [Streptomyces endocoffeicus]|uniref:Ig-like domain-containing protein n=1 Tax=Streptomyces endocoffeicus TaxID=2898945 RepID=UPI0027DB802B|nr:Ig-like domain-containing protein [Streptomyces endocoffeicus]
MTFTATVTPIAPGAGVPTGTVTFSISGSGGGTFAQPLSGGVATLSLSTLGVGTHTVVAIYNGDANFLPSSGTDTHTVNPGPAATTTTLMSSVNPSVFGQPVTFTATVTPNAPATGIPTGTARCWAGPSAPTTGPVRSTVASATAVASTAVSGAVSATADPRDDTTARGQPGTRPVRGAYAVL